MTGGGLAAKISKSTLQESETEPRATDKLKRATFPAAFLGLSRGFGARVASDEI
jgi:hypothetical protein